MKLSIIIPVHNAEKTIQTCIASVEKAVPPDYEILLIENGSEDKSRFLCEQAAIKNSRIKVFIEQKKGASKARNRGLEESGGEYIAFVDADDTIEENAYQKMLQWMDEPIDLITCNARKQEVSGQIYKKVAIQESTYRVNAPDEAISDLMFFHYASAVWGKVFRKDRMLDENGQIKIWFDENLTAFEDLVFLVKYLLSCHGTVIRCQEAMYYYRIRSKQEEGKIAYQRTPIFFKAYQIVFEDCKNLCDQTITHIQLKYAENAMRLYLNYGKEERRSKSGFELLQCARKYQQKYYHEKKVSYVRKLAMWLFCHVPSLAIHMISLVKRILKKKNYVFD